MGKLFGRMIMFDEILSGEVPAVALFKAFPSTEEGH
jgi:hypothetical protein